MFKSGSSREKAVSDLVSTVTSDLSELLETDVKASFQHDKTLYEPEPVFGHMYDYASLEHDLVNQDTIESQELTVYEETPDLLESYSVTESVQNFKCGLLKSNCRVTSQPDWGDVYIHILGKNHVTPESMLKYIVSFRNECHFHEEICETMYKRLFELLSPSELCVTCLYARRGGIDINPTRANKEHLLPANLIDPTIEHCKTQKQ